jgi:glycosyltransferase involved in cell wall biosynthesis
VVFIYREAALIGPAILERLARRLGAPIVYDIDDPIFLYLPSVISGAFSRLKFPGKIKRIMRMSDQVIAINDLIAGYARKHNDHVAIVPNFLDPDHFRPSAHPPEAPRIGWSGSVTTMLNLHGIAGPLSEIQQRFGTPVQVIGTGDFELPGVKLDIRQWTPETEVSDLQECNIGVLPVVDRPENEWKFFLKLVQYLSTGLAIVADRAGSNADVIQDGINGFIVDTPEQWVDRLSLLIEDKALRERMGRAARQTAIDRYSVKVQMPRVAAIFDDLLARATT